MKVVLQHLTKKFPNRSKGKADVIAVHDFDFEILGDVLDKMEDHEKYGYALFTYSESAKGYHATMDIYEGGDFLGDVYIYFKDGKLTKITIHAESEIGKVDCVYTFTYQ